MESDKDYLEWIGRMQLMLFGCVWAGFGIFAFFMIQHWGQEVDRKMGLIASGKAPAVTMYVVSVTPVTTANGRSSNGWDIGLSLRAQERNPRLVEDYENTQALGEWAVGQKVTAYQIDNAWFVPRVVTGGFGWGKWLFLAFGLVPPMIGVAIGLALRRGKRRARVLANEK